MASQHINDEGSFRGLIEKNPRVVVDFYSTYCPPCANLAPIYERLSEKYPDVPFIKLMRQDNRELAQSYYVMSSPTILFFKDGMMQDARLCGNIGQDELEKALKDFVSQ